MAYRVLGVAAAVLSTLAFVACGETEKPNVTGSGGTGNNAGSAGKSAQAGSTSAGQGHGGAPDESAGSGSGGEPVAGTANAGAGGESGGAAGAATGGAGDGGSGGAVGDGGAGGDGGSGGDGTDPLPPPPNVVFITSVSYAPTQIGGLAGADEKCNDLAEDALLEGTFVAWLSTSTVNAKDRLGSASAWRNPHGNPFADQQSELVDDEQIYFPINYDEYGDPVYGLVATGTTGKGLAAPQNCADWTTDASGTALLAGEPTAGSKLWTANDDGASCGEDYHLYCFQIDHQAHDVPTPSQGRTVFVSSQPFVLGAQGRAAADQLCNADAQAADLGGGPYVALLGTSTTDALSRLTQPTRVWVRPDGMTVANGNSAFELGLPLQAPITQRANGTHAGGVAIFGAPHVTDDATLSCAEWTDPNAGPGVILGITGHTDERWYGAETSACSDSAHVLCVEQ